LGIEGGHQLLDGIDIMPMIQGSKTSRDVGIGFESGPQATWVEDRYKLVRHKDQVELYDLVTDQQESKDLSYSMPELASRMSAALLAWQESCKK
ncbi:MAG: hypothetical protein KDB53_00165, partial [Planctomycetes bacterium]|nr:hypothetical protein [Planctomycetota bacterium]